MKRVMKFFAVLLCTGLLFTGCSSDQKGTSGTENESNSAKNEVVARGEYTASDFCKIENYKGITLAKKDVAASKEDIQTQVNALLSSKKTLKKLKDDHKAEKGDVVNIDYTGYMDGKKFDGGSDTGFNLELGSGSFIAGFEDGLIGTKKGDQKDLNLTFPDPYANNPNFSGKKAVFKVTVNSVNEYVEPKYTDEFVANNTEYKTIADYEKSISDKIQNDNTFNAMANYLYTHAEFSGKYPESLRKYYEKQYLNSYISILGEEEFEKYLKSIGKDREAFVKEELSEPIESVMKEDLIVGVIAEKENIKAEGQEYEDYLTSQANQYGMEKEELLKEWPEAEFTYISAKVRQLVYDQIIIK